MRVLGEGEKASPTLQMATHHLLNKAKQSGFEVIQYDDTDVTTYLDSETLARIDKALKSARVHTYPHSRL